MIQSINKPQEPKVADKDFLKLPLMLRQMIQSINKPQVPKVVDKPNHFFNQKTSTQKKG
jgi:hypothetical protein